MKKYFCDACGTETKRIVKFSFPCHLFQKNIINDDGYSDNDGNEISDRLETIELCAYCSNRAYSAALKSLDLL